MAAAQDNGATPTPTEAPTETPLPTINLTLFRETDSLTLLVPAAIMPVSLTGFEMRVTLTNGQTIIRRLDRDFAAFLGLPFGQANSLGAVCFRLVRAGAGGPVPIECGSGPLLLTQPLAAGDIFWFDTSSGLARILTVWQDGAFVGLCPAEQSACPITLTLRPVTPTPTPTISSTTHDETPTASPTSPPVQSTVEPTPGYPCEGTIIFHSGGVSQVKVSPLRGAPNKTPVQQGSSVQVLGRLTSEGMTWYQISYASNTGWITDELVELSATCP